ncbi:EAL domain-containing protein [Vibrio coralliilyticus]|uniref:EAL domain-containing protein n=1 Tax=Vibrio coralliilyticus TaxID=190893 RepID=A0AAN0W071_9VIBR|nr:EAL domain-containing protein [Vibrio coralliilyticus]AIW22578.1 hypothetical protein IX92_26310 [Vibrio coralliilyticus]NOH36676.1 EAL domain-containing protein [Vibrio coralliilyticus]
MLKLKKRLIIALAYLLGLGLLAIYAHFTLERMADEAARISTLKIDESIDGIQRYYEQDMKPVLELSNCDVNQKDCEQFLNSVSSFLFVDPAIRSVSISDKKDIYCSSISRFKRTPIPYSPEDFLFKPNDSEIRLFYLKQNGLFRELKDYKSKGTLQLRFYPHDDRIVHIALHPNSFFALLPYSPYYKLKLDFVNASFYSDGSIIETPTALTSGKSYEVSHEVNPDCLYSYILSHYSFIIVFWTLIVVSSSNVMYSKLSGLNLDYWRIKRGLSKHQFEPFLQPIFNADGTLRGAEILARWVHPKKGLIPPYKFIGQAESNGQIKEITTQLMDKCIVGLKHADFNVNSRFHLALNVCPIQFEDRQLFRDLDKFKLAFHSKSIELIVELTERQEFANNELYVSSINNLKSRNTPIALDDFGTGFCSMKYLLETEVNIIKIDRSYVSTIDSGPNTSILDSIISLARSINVPLLAEGVETEEQFTYLKGKDIEEFQGYLFGRPIPLIEFVDKYLSNKE